MAKLRKHIIFLVIMILLGTCPALAQQSAVQSQSYQKSFVQDFFYALQLRVRQIGEKLSSLREAAATTRERMRQFHERLKAQSLQAREKLDELRRKMQENAEKNRELQQRNLDLQQRNKDRSASQRAQMEALLQTQKDRARQ
jgi:hypothetical protein